MFLLISSDSFSQLIRRDASAYPEAVRTNCGGPDYVNCEIKLLPAVVGMPYLFDVKLSEPVINPSADFVTNLCTGTSTSPSFTFPDPTTMRVTIPADRICQLTPINIEIEVHVHVENEGGDVDDQNFKIPLPRAPVKIAMVLDISGSMQLPVLGDDTDPLSRWEVLKIAVKTFMDKFEILRVPKDSLALTYFTTYTIQPEFTTYDNFIEITRFDLLPATNLSSSIIDTDLNLVTRHPLYTTAMGLGLLDGKSKLRGNTVDPNGAKKVVLLFTDGLQNVHPFVEADGVNLDNSQKLNDCDPCTPPINQQIKYFTISMGALEVPPVLGAIATANGGATENTTTGDLSQLSLFFTNQWITMLNSSSPQIVSNKIVKSLKSNATYSFKINRNIKTLLFELVSRDCDTINWEVKKDGIPVSPNLIRADQNHKLMAIYLPYNNKDTILYSGGNWEITLTGNSERQYMLTCFADDHFLDYEFGLNKSIFTVGDSLKFSGRIDYAGKPLKGENIKVEAVVFKPGDDLGNMLSEYTTPDSLRLNDVDDPAQQKYQNLMINDSSFYHTLLAKEQIVELKEDSQGLFSGSFSSTELCGVYKIVYLINGEIPQNGSVQRAKGSEAIFIFGNVAGQTPVVVPNSPHHMTDSSKFKNLTAVRIRPKNKFGYLMGPGFKSQINVVINPGRKINSASLFPLEAGKDGTFVKEIIDNLDGSYLIYFVNPTRNSNPDIRIDIRGETLYEGKECPLPCWVKILIIILILLLILLRFLKSRNIAIYNIILWFISLIVLIIILLHYFGIIRIFC